MAISLYNGVTLGTGSDADVVTNWSTGNQDTDSQIQGNACVGAKTGNGITRYLYTNPTTLNFGTGGAAENRGIYIWYNFLTAGFLNNAANGGVRGFVGNATTTNYEEFTTTQIADDIYNGGWANVVIAGTGALGQGNFSAGTYAEGSADVFGITYNSTSNIMGNFNNGLVDQITIAQGLQATGTENFTAFVTAESTNIWGIMLTANGIFFPQGKVVIGNGSTSTTFTSSGETVVFTKQPVADVDGTFYELLFNSNSTTTFGTLSAGVTSAGTSISCADSTQSLQFNCAGTSTVNFYASTLDRAGVVSLNSTTTFQGSTVSNSGQVDVNGASITDCVITSSTSTATQGAIKIDSPTEMAGVTDCTFTNNTNAIEITAAGTYDLDTLTFSGNTNIIYFSPTSGNLTLNLANGTTAISDVIGTDVIFNAANTAGTLTVNNNVELSITGLLGNTEVRVYENPSLFTGGASSTEVAGVETVAAVTQTNTGSNYIFYSEDINPNVTQIQRFGAGVDFTTIGLVSGDKIRVVVRDNVDNPTLQLFDEFEVDGTVTSTVIPVVDVPSSSTKFSSVIGSTTNAKTVTIEKVNATQTFSLAAATYDVFVYRTGSLPIVTKAFALTNDTKSIPISQAGDRVYNNPA